MNIKIYVKNICITKNLSNFVRAKHNFCAQEIVYTQDYISLYEENSAINNNDCMRSWIDLMLKG